MDNPNPSWITPTLYSDPSNPTPALIARTLTQVGTQAMTVMSSGGLVSN